MIETTWRQQELIPGFDHISREAESAFFLCLNVNGCEVGAMAAVLPPCSMILGMGWRWRVKRDKRWRERN
jgi:hypothetical protein